MILARTAVAGLLLAASATAGRADDQAPPAITVTGEASVEVAPDTAILTIGVAAERPTAAAATADMAAAAQALTAALKAQGIPERDVATAALELSPVAPDPDTKPPRAAPPRAFRATTTFRVTVRPVEKAGPLASALVTSGANTIEGIDYGLDNQADRLDALRATAARDARHKAQVYAGALDLHLGRVLDITPADAPMPMRRMRMSAVLAGAPAPSIPTVPGLVTLSTSVTVRWAIEP